MFSIDTLISNLELYVTKRENPYNRFLSFFYNNDLRASQVARARTLILKLQDLKTREWTSDDCYKACQKTLIELIQTRKEINQTTRVNHGAGELQAILENMKIEHAKSFMEEGVDIKARFDTVELGIVAKLEQIKQRLEADLKGSSFADGLVRSEEAKALAHELIRICHLPKVKEDKKDVFNLTDVTEAVEAAVDGVTIDNKPVTVQGLMDRFGMTYQKTGLGSVYPSILEFMRLYNLITSTPGSRATSATIYNQDVQGWVDLMDLQIAAKAAKKQENAAASPAVDAPSSSPRA